MPRYKIQRSTSEKEMNDTTRVYSRTGNRTCRAQRGRRRGDGQKEDWTVTMQHGNLISKMSWDEIVLLDKGN
ncbi:hypothetical protein QQF64_011741 [Cirrhinus molitorella]|uniref:Uncharacterized protein n=1 Tax=Cirrhinus molitorella TaxID=172907 RepID=A0ABR3LVZ6_9TELE